MQEATILREKRRPAALAAALLAVIVTWPAALPAADSGQDAREQAPTQQRIEEVVVTASRLAEPDARRAYASTRLPPEVIATAPELRLDAMLAQVPGVGLFRRASSLVAHPTTQGITLRGIGPNGAGRALVLLDGVPLNDPFGGWVYWSALDPAMIGAAEIVRGGGAGPFGNQALTGAIRLETRRPEASELRGEARFGTFETRHVSGLLGHRGEPGAFSISGHFSDSDGFNLRPARQRGPVDVPAESETRAVNARGELDLGEATTLRGRIGYFSEERVNGLALSTNETDAFDASIGLVADRGREAPSYQLSLYWHDRDFANTFSAVFDEQRSIEGVVLDQFDVPAWGAGAVGLVRWPLFEDAVLELGADLRRLSGETNERFSGLEQLREAGGEQWLAGIWGEYAGSLTDRATVTAGLRVDHWRTFDGMIRERRIEDGEILRDDPVRNRHDLLVNGRLGMTYALAGAATLRAAAYSGFRLPTINEFFRPFRVGNDITEANPGLDPERLYGGELGITYRPVDILELSLDYFRNWLSDGVANVTLAEGPGVFPPFDSVEVPEGGTLRQRRNLGRIVADGVEFEAALTPHDSVSLELRYLFVNARITRARDFPELEGNRLAQSPRHSASADVRWQPFPLWRITVRSRFTGEQFEDDLGSRSLSSFTSVDLAIFYDWAEWLSFFVAGENLFDNEIESQIDADGLITRASPRSLSGGIRLGL